MGFKISFKKSDRVYINKEELDTLKNITLNNNLSKVRDIFLFSCYTGLSYIDLYNLSLKNIRKGYDGLQWIYIKRQQNQYTFQCSYFISCFFYFEKNIKKRKI